MKSVIYGFVARLYCTVLSTVLRSPSFPYETRSSPSCSRRLISCKIPWFFSRKEKPTACDSSHETWQSKERNDETEKKSFQIFNHSTPLKGTSMRKLQTIWMDVSYFQQIFRINSVLCFET